MIIIIPIGGIGKRFKDNGYKNPKALINLYGKPIITYLLDNLNVDNIEYVFIPYNKEYRKFRFEDYLTKNYPKIKFKFHCLENNTRGAAETINIGINHLNETKDTPVLCLDSDNFYLCDIISQWNGKNCIFSFEDFNNNPIYSYVKTNNNNEVIDIKEKEKISNYACTGAYGFSSINELKKYTKKIINENITQKSEFYTSGVIKEMINNGINFVNVKILNKNYFSLGTLEQLNEYENPFIFDLDGTLVDTDYIYTQVWNKIMKEYNITIDNNFFKYYIQGKNDLLFLKDFFNKINNEEINNISNKKDKMFIEYLKVYDKEIMLEGVQKFLNKHKNRRMGIVTSCNKKSAEFILQKTKIGDYMQFLITSDDCKNHKPHPEPYKKAIDILKCNKKNCTIFEDSYSGYKSALALGGTNICLILNNNSSESIIKSNEYKIQNYNDFNINKLIINENQNILIPIKEKLQYLGVKDVTLLNKYIKTGYICDIKSIELIFNDTKENIIIKIENEENELSNVARNINLYNNESYFYEKISKIINVNVPKYYCGFKINNKQAILLENLNSYNGCFNINLNNNIDMLILIVKNITEMHNRFYFETSKNIIENMKNVIKIDDILYYNKLIDLRFNDFVKNNIILLANQHIKILNNIFKNYKKLMKCAGKFPLSFCHGDLKSPNIFYKEINSSFSPIFLDWQYIHLNKGISDITFLLVESTEFNEIVNDVILKYCFQKYKYYKNFNDLMFDFKVSLCIFPFLVMVWFGSENRDNLLDKVFPIKFMKNTLKFYNKYLNDDFFVKIQNS